MICFKQGCIEVLNQQYQLVPQKGYPFHLPKNICREAQKFGLAHLYLNNEQFALANHARNEKQAISDYF